MTANGVESDEEKRSIMDLPMSEDKKRCSTIVGFSELCGSVYPKLVRNDNTIERTVGEEC